MSSPAWYIKNRGHINAWGDWVRPERYHHAFIWPKDKPGTSRLGRLADCMTGKGPDIFIASNPNKKPHAMDGPSRRRWTGFPTFEDNPDTYFADANAWLGNAPWLGGGRHRKPYYDFHTRRFRSRPHHGMWTNVMYGPDNSSTPAAIEQWRDMNIWQPVGDPLGNTQYLDRRNWGQNGYVDGVYGGGGYYNPVLDGWP